MKRLSSFLLCCTAACGAANDPGPAAIGSAALHREGRHQGAKALLFAADALYSAQIERLGPVEGLLAKMGPDASLLAAGVDLALGKPKSRALLQQIFSDPARTLLQRTLAGGDVSADGRFGFTFGWHQLSTPAADGTTTTAYGTHVVAWSREDDDEPFQVQAYLHRTSPTAHAPARDGFPLLIGGPGAGGVPHHASRAHNRRSLLETDRAFAAASVRQGFSIAFPAFNFGYVLVSGRDHHYIEGIAEVTDWYSGWTPAETLDWTPLQAGTSESGDLGFTVGTWVDSFVNPDGTVDRAYGKYLDLWARTAEGAWRFIGDAGASSPAPAQ